METPLEYVGKRVTVTFNDEGEVRVITGTVNKANAACLMVRPKGRPFVLIDTQDVAAIVVLEEEVKAARIKVRSMEQILDANVRQHLADRHGVPVAEIPDDDAAAEKMHEAIDHSKLGHHHRPDEGEVANRAEMLAAVSDGVADDDEDEED